MKAEPKWKWTKTPLGMLLAILLTLLLSYGVLNVIALCQPCPTQLPWNGKDVAAPMIGAMAELRQDGTRIAVDCSIDDPAVYSATVYVWKDEVCLDPAGKFVFPILTWQRNRTLRYTFDAEPGADYRICLDLKAQHGLRYLYCLTPMDTPMFPVLPIDVLDAATGEHLYSIQEQEDGKLTALTRTPIALPTAG